MEGPYVAINAAPLAGNGSGAATAMNYQFFDGDVSPGATYYYKLERVHGEGPPEYSQALPVTLLPVGEPPVADAGPDRMVSLTDGAEREPVLLDASGSFDPDGTIVEYGWYKSGGWMTSAVSPTVRLTDGVHTLTLMVTDNDGVTASDDIVIRVSTGSTEIGEIVFNAESSLDPGTDGVANPGDPIHYSLSVQNTGNLTLTNVTVTEPTLSNIDCGGGTNLIATLVPGEVASCSGAYAITQADIDAGAKDSMATTTAQDPNGNELSDQRSWSQPIPQAAAIRLDTSAALDLGTDDIADPGDLIHYTFAVENTDNVTLIDVAVTEPTISHIDCGGGGNRIGTMAPGYKATCRGSYAITQADIDVGRKDSVATAAARDPNGKDVSDQSSLVTEGLVGGTFAAPSQLTVQSSGSIVTLGWSDNSSNEEGFSIERGTKRKGTVQYTPIAEVSPGVTGFSEELSSGTYYYRLLTFNRTTGSVSGYSNTVEVRIKGKPGQNR